MSTDILIIDDEKSLRKGLKMILKKNYSVTTAANGQEGLKRFHEKTPAIILLDIGLPDISGMEVLKKIKEQDKDSIVIMLTAVEDSKSIVKAIKLDAYDYLVKPVESSDILLTMKNAMEKIRLKEQLQIIQNPLIEKYKAGFVCKDEKFQEILETARKVAKSRDTKVLLLGESGVGKGMLARYIHYSSSDTFGPFVIVNCGAIAKDLLESELFGYKAGAFTGALERGKKGRFEEAANGTLVLDEIGVMSMSAQVKLLQVLEDKIFFRVGGIKPIPLDARIISITNSNIEKAVLKGEFRKDLFYRINTVTINIPPLYERQKDLIFLIHHFMKMYNSKFNKNFSSIAPETKHILMQYKWPGNIRELKNIIERIILMEKGDTILPEHLPFLSDEITDFNEKKFSFSFECITEKYHKKMNRVINNALTRTDNNVQKAARLFNIPTHKLRYKMKKLGIKIINS